MCNTFHSIDTLSEFIRGYNHSIYRPISARPVDVIRLNSVRVWKIESWDSLKEYAPLLEKGEHITVFITKVF